jgi:hypothetical protein
MNLLLTKPSALSSSAHPSLERIKPKLKQIKWAEYENHRYRGVEHEDKFNPISVSPRNVDL